MEQHFSSTERIKNKNKNKKNCKPKILYTEKISFKNEGKVNKFKKRKKNKINKDDIKYMEIQRQMR